MPDYKKMYLTMMRASNHAVNLLIAAQRECEEHYISSPEPELIILPPANETEKGADEKGF